MHLVLSCIFHLPSTRLFRCVRTFRVFGSILCPSLAGFLVPPSVLPPRSLSSASFSPKIVCELLVQVNREKGWGNCSLGILVMVAVVMVSAALCYYRNLRPSPSPPRIIEIGNVGKTGPNYTRSAPLTASAYRSPGFQSVP